MTIGEIKQEYVNQYKILQINYSEMLRYIFLINHFFLILYLKDPKLRKCLEWGKYFCVNSDFIQ